MGDAGGGGVRDGRGLCKMLNNYRPVFYPVRWPRQFAAIDALVERRMRTRTRKEGGWLGVEV